MSSRFFPKEGLLFIKGFQSSVSRYLVGEKATEVLKEVQSAVYGEHHRVLGIFKQLINLSYYWPTMRLDIASFTRR